MTGHVLGIDLGTSGVRIAVLAHDGRLVFSAATPYRSGLQTPEDWRDACRDLIRSIPEKLRLQLLALAVDGTSGTLLACDRQGTCIGEALIYSQVFPELKKSLEDLIPEGGPAASCSGSLARALTLSRRHGSDILLRHQADWISGWLLDDWRWGEEGNNIRLGWNLDRQAWHPSVAAQNWSKSLPMVRPSGVPLGRIVPRLAGDLGLPDQLLVVSGTTDSNAAVLAANPGTGDGITVLGTTLVVKRFTDTPINAPGVTRHRVAGKWLCGGASNAGAGVLRRFFADAELEELSRQINPETESGLTFRPLPAPGERFPVDDPTLEPVLEPRPISDALYLHGLLEGLAEIEARGWERLSALGAPPPQRVITLGGGARNPQWRRLRERRLQCPVLSCTTPPAAGAARLALEALPT